MPGSVPLVPIGYDYGPFGPGGSTVGWSGGLNPHMMQYNKPGLDPYDSR
jgi:hypothetical protein